MTHDEIRAAIGANPALQALVPDTVALAAALSSGRMRYKPLEIGTGTIVEVLTLDVANPVIDAIYAEPKYRHIKPLLEQGRLRLDIAAMGGTLQPLVVAGLLSQPQLDALIARAKEPDSVGEFDVRCAIFADDGSLRV